MWFPPELWRLIKNYLLGKKYLIIKFNNVLTNLPKQNKYIFTSYIYLKNLSFFIQFEKVPYNTKNPVKNIMIYSRL